MRGGGDAFSAYFGARGNTAFIHGSLVDTHVIVVATLEQSEINCIAITPDWERVYFFESEGEGVLYTPGVPEFF